MGTEICILILVISYLLFLILLTIVDNRSSVLCNIRKKFMLEKKSKWIFTIIIPILVVFLFGLVGKYIINLPNYSMYIFVGLVLALVQKLIYQEEKK